MSRNRFIPPRREVDEVLAKGSGKRGKAKVYDPYDPPSIWLPRIKWCDGKDLYDHDEALRQQRKETTEKGEVRRKTAARRAREQERELKRRAAEGMAAETLTFACAGDRPVLSFGEAIDSSSISFLSAIRSSTGISLHMATVAAMFSGSSIKVCICSTIAKKSRMSGMELCFAI